MAVVTLEDRVLIRLAVQGGRSGGSIALEIGKGDRQVQRVLKRLQGAGLVAHNGIQGRGSRWYLVEDPDENWEGRASCLGAWAETALVQGQGEVYGALKVAEAKLR